MTAINAEIAVKINPLRVFLPELFLHPVEFFSSWCIGIQNFYFMGGSMVSRKIYFNHGRTSVMQCDHTMQAIRILADEIIQFLFEPTCISAHFRFSWSFHGLVATFAVVKQEPNSDKVINEGAFTFVKAKNLCSQFI